MKTKSALIFSLFAASVAGIPVFAQESVADEKLELVAAGTVTEAENVVSRRYPGRVVSPASVAVTSRVSGDLVEVAFKEGDFVKWQSYGKLGYSIITLIISLVAGFLFNVSPYLPMILSFVCTVVGLVFAIIYSEPKVESASIESTSIKSLLKNKLMLLVFLMNLFGVGAYVFMQSKATLLIQYVCQDVNIDLAKISLIVSGIVFGSRLFMVASNMVYPHIYKKVKNRSRILLFVSLAIVFSGVCFAIGANISTNYIVNLVIITIGFYIILSIRDIYDIAESRILTTNLEQSQQKQAVVLANIYGNCGRLFSNAFALLILNAFPLNILYIFILIFAVAQVFIGILLSKHLK